MTACPLIKGIIIGLLALLLGVVARVHPAAAQSLSAEAAGDRARLSFLWDGPVAHSASVVSGVLIVQFNRPFTGSLDGAIAPVSEWVAGAAATSDRRTITFPLRSGYTLRDLSRGVAVVLELVGPPTQTPGSLAVAPPGGGAGTPAPAAAPPAPAPSAAPSVRVRTGEHDSYFRVVFDWPRNIPYTVSEQTDAVTVEFGAGAQINVAQLRTRLPDGFDAELVSAQAEDGGVTVRLPKAPGGSIRHFRSGNSIAVDLRYGAGGAPAASAQEDAPEPPPSAPAQTTQESTPAPAPAPVPEDPTAVPPPRTDTAANTAADTTPVAPATGQASSVPPPRSTPTETETAQEDVATPAPRPVGSLDPQRDPSGGLGAPLPGANDGDGLDPDVPSVLGSSGEATDSSPVPGVERLVASREEAQDFTFSRELYTVSFSWDRPTAAAAFRRAGYLWVVFDRFQEVDLSILRITGGEALQFVEQVNIGNEGTAVRMIVDPSFNPTFRREQLLWIMDLQRRPMRPERPIEVSAQLQSPAGPRLYLPVAEGGNVVRFRDPEVGDRLIVVPVIPLGNGVFPSRKFPDLSLPVTAQGIVIEPYVDDLQVRSSRQGVEITSAAGLRLSPDADRLAALAGLGGDEGLSGIFNIAQWRGNMQETYRTRREAMLEAVSIAPRSRRNEARLELARFYFANGYAPEALGVLRTILNDGGDNFLNRPTFRAVRGGARLLMGRYNLAVEDLSHPGLADVDEAAFWRAAAQVRIGNPALQAGILDETGGVIGNYPKDVRVRMAMIAAEGTIAGANDLAAHNFLEVAASSISTPHQQVQLAYLEGLLHESTGSFEDAIESWRTASEGKSRKWSTFAKRKLLEMEFQLDRITEEELIAGLERVRFDWRGDDFEYGLLRRLAGLHLDGGDFGAGLRLLKLAATYFRNRPDVDDVTDQMALIFEDLYLRGMADRLSPVTAIALYDEFRELTPPGEDGDEMIRQLADRLVAVDLLEQASTLLERQLANRLTEPGEERARVGARLGLVHLLDGQAQSALNTLQTTDTTGLPQELSMHRTHLTARALADLNRPNDAIARLEGDDSEDARMLRAEIYWRAQNWPQAARALSTLVPPPVRGETLDGRTAMRVLDWATALTLAGDEAQVALLRRRYLDPMRDTDYFEAFDLFTTAGERDIPDYRTINQTVQQADDFRSYLSAYRERLRNERLSALN